MHLNVFIFGRPGSGKSSVAQFIQEIAGRKGWDIEYVYDYKLLQDLFQQEIGADLPSNERRFNSIKNNEEHGFDVKDFAVLDEVLDTIADQMTQERSMSELANPGGKRLYLIEFARNNYENA